MATYHCFFLDTTTSTSKSELRRRLRKGFVGVCVSLDAVTLCHSQSRFVERVDASKVKLSDRLSSAISPSSSPTSSLVTASKLVKRATDVSAKVAIRDAVVCSNVAVSRSSSTTLEAASTSSSSFCHRISNAFIALSPSASAERKSSSRVSKRCLMGDIASNLGVVTSKVGRVGWG